MLKKLCELVADRIADHAVTCLLGLVGLALASVWRRRLRSFLLGAYGLIAVKLHFRHVETDEEREAREHSEMMNSEDPDVWKPL